MTNPIFTEIENYIKSNDIVLFMKGNKKFPQCGFSSAVVQILSYYDIEFLDINILDDQEIRQAIKDFSNWPTIPQLYVKGEFIGGCDIIREMFETGELKELFEQKELLAS